MKQSSPSQIKGKSAKKSTNTDGGLKNVASIISPSTPSTIKSVAPSSTTVPKQAATYFKSSVPRSPIETPKKYSILRFKQLSAKSSIAPPTSSTLKISTSPRGFGATKSASSKSSISTFVSPESSIKSTISPATSPTKSTFSLSGVRSVFKNLTRPKSAILKNPKSKTGPTKLKETVRKDISNHDMSVQLPKKSSPKNAAVKANKSTTLSSQALSNSIKSKLDSDGNKSELDLNATKSKLGSDLTKSNIDSSEDISKSDSGTKKSELDCTKTSSKVDCAATKSDLDLNGKISKSDFSSTRSKLDSGQSKSDHDSAATKSVLISNDSKSKSDLSSTTSDISSTDTKSKELSLSQNIVKKFEIATLSPKHDTIVKECETKPTHQSEKQGPNELKTKSNETKMSTETSGPAQEAEKKEEEEGLGLEKTISKLDVDGLQSKESDSDKKTQTSLPTLARKMIILYAGETGNSEDVARRTGWEAERRRFQVRVQPFDEYEIKNLVNERLALFVCSTVNEGDEPNQMRRFWRFIMKRGLPSDCLGALRFGTIALGDSSYRRFAVAGKKLHRRLTLLGAQSIVALCVGDDQHDLGFNATVDPWLREYWRAVDTLVVPPIDLNTGKPIDLAKEDDLPAPLFEIVFLDSKPSAPSIQTINIKTSLPTANQARPTENRTSSAVLRSYSSFAPDELDEYENETAVTNTRSNVVAQVGSLQSCDFNHDIQNPYWARVISNERVTDASHWQETRLLRLHMPSHQMPYKSNDVIHVMPSNSDQDVRCLLNIYNLTGMERVQVHRRRKMIGGRCVFDALSDRVLTTRELFTRYVCFSTRPKQSLFELLWRVADREMERDKLKLLASENGVGELLEYVTRPRRTALEVLVDFERVAKFWPIQRLLDLLSPLEPRRFSIAGSSGTCPNELQILYAVVEFKTRMQTPRLGVCTSYLRTLTAGARLPCFIRPGTLRLPPDSKTPLILIATGTGVAPMRSLIEQRAENNVSNNFLFFGCRGRTLDMYFADEWAELNARGLLYYYTAFSRQAINPSHIQHRLWEQRQLLWHLLATCDAYVYVAGRAGPMPRDVRATLLRMLKDQGADQLPDNQAEVLLDRLEQKGRIQYECWC